MRTSDVLETFLEITLAIVFLAGWLLRRVQKKNRGETKKPGDLLWRGPGKTDARPGPAAVQAAAPAAPVQPAAPAEPAMSAPRASAGTAYVGSLGMGPMEGLDPCHPDPEPSPARPESHPGEDAPGTPLFQPAGWTGNDIVRGFVFSEILRRKNVS